MSARASRNFRSGGQDLRPPRSRRRERALEPPDLQCGGCREQNGAHDHGPGPTYIAKLSGQGARPIACDWAGRSSRSVLSEGAVHFEPRSTTVSAMEGIALAADQFPLERLVARKGRLGAPLARIQLRVSWRDIVAVTVRCLALPAVPRAN